MTSTNNGMATLHKKKLINDKTRDLNMINITHKKQENYMLQHTFMLQHTNKVVYSKFTQRLD